MLTKILKPFKLLQRSEAIKRDLEQIKKPRGTEYLKPIYTKVQKPSYYGLCGVKTEYNIIWPIFLTHGFSVSTHEKDMIAIDSIPSSCGSYIYYAEKGSQVISEDEYNKATGEK